MGKPIALKGHFHSCPRTVPLQHVGGPITNTQNLVKVNGIPVATMGDDCICTGTGQVDRIIGGSSTVRINGKGVARKGDGTAHGGQIEQGVSSVNVN